MSKNYFEILYQGPYKGVNSSLPEDVIGKEFTPAMQNFILKNGEIRTRPLQTNYIPNTPDGFPIQTIASFLDGNNVFHTIAVTPSGLFQLNRNWNIYPRTPRRSWAQIGQYPVLPGPNIPVASAVFTNKFFWTNAGNNLWVWDGISSPNAPRRWQASIGYILGAQILDTNGNLQVVTTAGVSGTAVPTWGNTLGAVTTDNSVQWTENGKPFFYNGFSSAAVVDATNGYTAGAYFLIELNAQLLMLNTIETTGAFTQRIRWSPSGLPTVWDPNVNIGAGYNDELDVPDSITGAFTVGTTAFVLRNNGITEITASGNSGQNPFNFNHLWASDRGIGNVFPFGYASYGPLGIFIASDDVYNVSLGGFKRIGKDARDNIFADLALTTGNPIGAIVPYYSGGYVYNQYRLDIPQGNNNVRWRYSIEDDSWQRDFNTNRIFTSQPRWVYTG